MDKHRSFARAYSGEDQLRCGRTGTNAADEERRARSRPVDRVFSREFIEAVRNAPTPVNAQAVSHRDTARAAPLPLVVPEDAAGPLCHTRCCIGGLVTLIALRGCAVSVYTSPAGLAWTAHMLSCAADSIATVGSLPVFVSSAIGSCVHHRCLGSLLTLLLTAMVCDVGAAIIFLSTGGGMFHMMGPAATDEGAPASFAFVGVWELILVSSISLEVALCSAAWQFYRAFREAGIYPPNGASAKVRKEVSPLEFLCEAEDVALLSDQCNACDRTPSRSMPGEDRQDFVRVIDVTLPFSEFEDAKLDVNLPVHTELLVNRL
uniref:Uncharacterized protein n=1 Tax=Pyrodinium bahamense TaxID=73915 RepID=A0A7S0FR41_9DINO|mmetsp:Transcript_41646/g.115985  ORF Transcript_41646/g.115985 Transcript_41646/m.115985 type:complete len:319 (+) Transcript_41646:61-1017(+)